MKFGIAEKITLGLVVLLGIFAAQSVHKTIKQIINPKYSGVVFINSEETRNYDIDVKKLSQKYHVYEDLYNSDQKVFTYSYREYTLTKNINTKFHKELQQRLAKENLNYKVIPYKNLDDYEKQVEYDNRAVYNHDEEKCLMDDPSVTELDKLRHITRSCLLNACIIDMKNKRYTVFSRDIDFIINILKEHNAD